jgi:UDP-glucose 4-epimerase
VTERKKILITGGAGFIGSHLAQKYAEDEQSVKVLDNFSSGNPNNIRSLFNYKNFKLIKGDVTDKELVRRVTMDVNVIFHLAAEIHVDKSIFEAEQVCKVNINGTLNILEAAMENDVEAVIYASSSEVYGSSQYVPMDEKHPLNPASPYAASKAAADRLCFAYFNTYKLPVVMVRSFNTYGPRQADRGYSAAIPMFITRVLQSAPPVIYGDGKQTRDYMYIKDAVKGYDAVLQSYDKLLGKAVNFGTGKETSILDIANIIIRTRGENKLTPIHTAPRPGEVKRLCADTSFAKKELGFKPEYDIESGLAELIQWYVNGGVEEWKAYTKTSSE